MLAQHIIKQSNFYPTKHANQSIKAVISSFAFLLSCSANSILASSSISFSICTLKLCSGLLQTLKKIQSWNLAFMTL